MDLDVMIMKFKELQNQVAEIREKLGLTGKMPEETAAQSETEAEAVEPEEAEAEEVEEHDPETGQTQKRRRRRS